MTDWRMCCITIIENAVVELADFEITTEIYKALFEGKAPLDVEYMATDNRDGTYLYHCIKLSGALQYWRPTVLAPSSKILAIE